MEVKKILQFGYFPKELPPPFHTEQFANNFDTIDYMWSLVDESIKKKYRETNFSRYTIPKVGFVRRTLGVPNPIHYTEISKLISDYWMELKNHFNQSNLSFSKPIEDAQTNRAITTEFIFSDFKNSCILTSFDRIYELKTDISRWYPSIYTHIIPWALHSKSVAKSRRRDHSLLGNKLDTAIRQSQSGQTIGIQIGPDTSLVISEIIGCYFDKLLLERFNDLKGGRYYDDYYLYFNSYSEAEEVLKYLQSIFGDHLVEINEEKTIIQQLPFAFEKEWAIVLSNYKFRKSAKGQLTDITNYISSCFQYAHSFPRDSVIKYAIKRLESVKFIETNWNIYESLLLKMTMIEPSIFPETLRIFLTWKNNLDKLKIKKFLEQVIKIHVSKSHHFEVLWALWFAKSFSIQLDANVCMSIIESSDYLSKIVVMDLYSNELIDKTEFILDSVRNDLVKDSLFDERWLFSYEIVKKGWLTPKESDMITSNQYFDILYKQGIEFYDSKKQLSKAETYSSSKKTEQGDESTDEDYLNYISTLDDEENFEGIDLY